MNEESPPCKGEVTPLCYGCTYCIPGSPRNIFKECYVQAIREGGDFIDRAIDRHIQDHLSSKDRQYLGTMDLMEDE